MNVRVSTVAYNSSGLAAEITPGVLRSVQEENNQQ